MGPVSRQTLPQDLARRIRDLIVAERYRSGDRLPSIAAMAAAFGVGMPTLREALKRLEAVGAIHIRHGSGVYVGRLENPLLVRNPVFDGSASKKLLLDLIEARLPIELETVALATENASEEDLDMLDALLRQAGAALPDGETLNEANTSFHSGIARASGNTVLAQLLEVLSTTFRREQRIILDIYGSRERDHAQHLEIARALRQRDRQGAVERMRAHLEGVREVLLAWNPDREPIG